MSGKEPAAGSVGAAGTIGRIVLVVATLGVEYLLVSISVDARSVLARGGIWRGAAALGSLGPILLAIAGAFFLRRVDASWISPRTKRSALVLHIACAAVAGVLTPRVFSTDSQATPALLLAWLGLVMVASLALVHGLFRLHPRARRPLALASLGATGIGLAAWLAGQGSASLWDPLGPTTLRCVVALLRALGVPVVAEGNGLAVGDFAVDIAPVCSGYEGIGLAALLCAGFLFIARSELRFPRAFLLVPLASALAWLANVARIAALMVVGAHWSETLAIGGFHSKAGWLFFSAATVSLAMVARSSRFFSRTAESKWEHPLAPYVGPLVAVAASGLLTGALTEGLDWWYALRLAAAAIAIWRYRNVIMPATRLRMQSLPVLVGGAVAMLWIAVPAPAIPLAEVAQGHFSALPAWVRGAWILGRLAGTIVVVPLCEELAFRGYLLRRFVAAEFDSVAYARAGTVAILVSSLAFGLVHGRFAVAAVSGVAYAWLAKRSDGLGDAIVAHATTNAGLSIYVLASGNWGPWL